jgi:hypothetical protein
MRRSRRSEPHAVELRAVFARPPRADALTRRLAMLVAVVSVAPTRLLATLVAVASVALFGCASAPPPAGSAPARCAAEGSSERPVVLASQAQVLRLAGCTALPGVVIRTGAALDLSVLRALITITGDLAVGPTVGLEEITFPALRTIGGALRIHDNGLVRGAFFPALAQAGSISIDHNVVLITASLPRLNRVGTLSITDGPSLELIDIAQLSSIDGALVLASLPKLTLVESAALQRTGSVRIDNAPELPEPVAARLRATGKE